MLSSDSSGRRQMEPAGYYLTLLIYAHTYTFTGRLYFTIEQPIRVAADVQCCVVGGRKLVWRWQCKIYTHVFLTNVCSRNMYSIITNKNLVFNNNTIMWSNRFSCHKIQQLFNLRVIALYLTYFHNYYDVSN